MYGSLHATSIKEWCHSDNTNSKDQGNIMEIKYHTKAAVLYTKLEQMAEGLIQYRGTPVVHGLKMKITYHGNLTTYILNSGHWESRVLYRTLVYFPSLAFPLSMFSLNTPLTHTLSLCDPSLSLPLSTWLLPFTLLPRGPQPPLSSSDPFPSLPSFSLVTASLPGDTLSSPIWSPSSTLPCVLASSPPPPSSPLSSSLSFSAILNYR